MELQQNPIELSELQPGQTLPLVISPTCDTFDLLEWAKQNTEWLEQKLLEHGGILFRNCNVTDIAAFETFTATLCPNLEDYTERSTPRSEVHGKVYTSTSYPSEQHIPMHNEMSYAYAWPKKIFFFSVLNAETGGETPIADSREVLKRLDPGLVQRFVDKKIRYVRNYMRGLDLPWEEVFQTTSKQEVEAYCRKTGMTWEWKKDGSLRTIAIRDALAKHPVTSELVWFNQAHLFHVSNLPDEVREALVFALGEENLTRNTYYGDGEQIEADVLAQIRAAYEEVTIKFPWQTGDILMLDNYLIAHGRTPFTGARKVVVTMGDVTSDRNL
ncbi:TauD/TfdA family dioxygenase [Tumebacillus permanentifrigoris]|uniref:Alpha-ketoglutarate-dependent taurine dioxygenase n=1 Tax=Tumebacillus permanentifrigoris TaxID=378543 RepID=A0A316DCC6_9BACL|nr:TauD/TfdA family dioxygenase [Tumebacillus permanentifrigoris]PWK15797.1 alpha-ketoglutarate-dependent taurine dioxygenase [Tumebacillus permanentifrigoris]